MDSPLHREAHHITTLAEGRVVVVADGAVFPEGGGSGWHGWHEQHSEEVEQGEEW